MSRFFKRTRKGNASFLGLGIGISALVVGAAAFLASLAAPSTSVADPPWPGPPGSEIIHDIPPPYDPPTDIEAWYQYLRDLIGLH